MADEIRAAYDQLDEVANRYANQSQAVEQLLQKVRSSMAPLEDGGWVGRGSDAFFQEMNSEVLPASQRLQDVLAEASQVTRAVAQIIQQAEDEASSLFRSSH
jgi:WXG100 family type VII secretion target